MNFSDIYFVPFMITLGNVLGKAYVAIPAEMLEKYLGIKELSRPKALQPDDDYHVIVIKARYG